MNKDSQNDSTKEKIKGLNTKTTNATLNPSTTTENTSQILNAGTKDSSYLKSNNKKLQRQNRNKMLKQKLGIINSRKQYTTNQRQDTEGSEEYSEEEEEEEDSPVLDPRSIEAVKKAYVKKVKSRLSVRIQKNS